jgi:hypothetical protein
MPRLMRARQASQTGLGYLDDLVIVPLGILLVVKLIPPELMAEFRHEAAQRGRLPARWGRSAVIITLWVVIGVLLVGWWFLPGLGLTPRWLA